MMNKEKIEYIGVMALYGTTGIIKRFIPYSSAFVACSRALIAAVFIFLLIKITGRKIDRAAIRANLPWLIVVGVLLSFNWITYFEACMHTTVAKASLCYYMAPVIVIAVSPFLFKEKLTLKKTLCVVAAVIGMVMVSGVLSGDSGRGGDLSGILIGLLAALMYAGIIICSRQVKDVSSYDKTLVQLIVATACLIPYLLLTEGVSAVTLSPLPVILVIVIGIVNTGFAYAIYFDSVTKLEAQTIALFAYADPVVSVLLSALVLHEKMDVFGIVGAVLIIGSLILSEITNP